MFKTDDVITEAIERAVQQFEESVSELPGKITFCPELSWFGPCNRWVVLVFTVAHASYTAVLQPSSLKVMTFILGGFCVYCWTRVVYSCVTTLKQIENLQLPPNNTNVNLEDR